MLKVALSCLAVLASAIAKNSFFLVLLPLGRSKSYLCLRFDSFSFLVDELDLRLRLGLSLVWVACMLLLSRLGIGYNLFYKPFDSTTLELSCS